MTSDWKDPEKTLPSTFENVLVRVTSPQFGNAVAISWVDSYGNWQIEKDKNFYFKVVRWTTIDGDSLWEID